MPSISLQKTVTDYNLTNRQVASTYPGNYGDPSINMWFPSDLTQGDQNPAFIMFQFFSYNRPSVFASPKLNSLGNVVFPMPTDLVDRVQLTYDERANGSAVGAALDQLASVGASQGNIANQIAAIGDAAGKAAEGVGLGVAGGALNLLNKVPGLSGASNIIPGGLQFMGMAQNPFLSILFSAPQFKRFGMTWTFIPETPQDSENLDFIIRKLKYHALPDIALGGLFFTYPDIIVPTIYPTGYFFDFKQCVLENVVVNYVPGNTPAVYSGTLAPTAVQITITLLEIALWYKGDFQPKSSSTNSTQSTPSGFGGSNPSATQPSRPYSPNPSSGVPGLTIGGSGTTRSGGSSNVPNGGSGIGLDGAQTSGFGNSDTAGVIDLGTFDIH